MAMWRSSRLARTGAERSAAIVRDRGAWATVGSRHSRPSRTTPARARRSSASSTLSTDVFMHGCRDLPERQQRRLADTHDGYVTQRFTEGAHMIFKAHCAAARPRHETKIYNAGASQSRDYPPQPIRRQRSGNRIKRSMP